MSQRIVLAVTRWMNNLENSLNRVLNERPCFRLGGAIVMVEFYLKTFRISQVRRLEYSALIASTRCVYFGYLRIALYFYVLV